MGKRSQARTPWPKRQQQPAGHTWRLWVCADCLRPTQLVTCADGKQRCPAHKVQFDQQGVLR